MVMELYMDDKWKLSKKGSRNASSSSRRTSASSAASEACGGGALLNFKCSMSMREGGRRSAAAAAAAAGRSFSSRCASLVKEQRARFYIMRRCVTMLICWRDYS